MPKIKNRSTEDYDFSRPMSVSIHGRNLPRYELDTRALYPKAESELEKDMTPLESGQLPQTVVLPKMKRVKAGKYMIKIPVKNRMVVSKQSLAYDQDMAILAWGADKGFKPKKK